MNIFLDNLSRYHHRIIANYLRKRGWVVFYLEHKHRKCEGNTCWLKLYKDEVIRNG